MHFGENQLSPGLISLSLRSTAHPRSFRPSSVRPSTKCYLSFSLAMDRSRGLRVHSMQLNAHLRLAFATATPFGLTSLHRSNSLTHDAKGTPSHVSKDIVLRLIVNIRFQVLFHASHRRPFHLSLTVLVRYRSLESI